MLLCELGSEGSGECMSLRGKMMCEGHICDFCHPRVRDYPLCGWAFHGPYSGTLLGSKINIKRSMLDRPSKLLKNRPSNATEPFIFCSYLNLNLFEFFSQIKIKFEIRESQI